MRRIGRNGDFVYSGDLFRLLLFGHVGHFAMAAFWLAWGVQRQTGLVVRVGGTRA